MLHYLNPTLNSSRESVLWNERLQSRGEILLPFRLTRVKPLPPKLVVFGEVGLAGEVRAVQRGQERLREAAKLGFTHALIPKANKARQAIPGMEVTAVERVEEAFAHVR